MKSYRSWAAVLMAVVLLAMAGSLPAGNADDGPAVVPKTLEGRTTQPVWTFDLTPNDVIQSAPFEPVQHVQAKPYTEKSPVNPEDYDAEVVVDDDGRVSMIGVSKMKMYLEKEQLSPTVEEELRRAQARGVPRDELSSDAMSPASQALANPFLITSGSVNSLIPDQGWHWRRVIDTMGNAPAGAVVTNLEYRLRIDDTGDPLTFYCGDYEIHLFTGAADRELMIYDNLGGRTDGGFDDDAEDDSDIYLNWRNTHFFDGDSAAGWFGVWIDDIYASDSGLLNYIEFYVHWEVLLPNLTCYQPAGWDSAIVASSVTGTNTADSLTGGEPAYIDWSVINNGSADVAGRFYTALYIDGDYVTQWFTDNLGLNWWAWINDYAQTLDTGFHEICIIADHTGLIAEENEQDNSCCFTYYWNKPYVPPNLHCYDPGWDGPLVVSDVRGTNTQADSVRVCDTAFIDWAVGNSGGSPTADRYYVRLLVDGVVAAAWFKDPPHDNGFYIWATDHPLFFPDTGTHTLTLEVDYTGAITEGNENDNSCEVATLVVECFDPNVACYQIDGWDGPIVVSDVPGGSTQGPVTVGQTAYIDFGVANIGNAATEVNVYHNMYIDGDSVMTWFSTPINPGDYRWVADYPWTFTTTGNHTIRLFHDATDAVAEPDEVDNICEITINVQPAAYLIAGRINDPGGGYIQGVSVDFSDVGVVVTDADGYYEQAVPAGWSGRATPSKACLEFLPTHRDYVNVTSHIPNQHYEGSVAQYTISGQVINSAGAGIPDVHMTGFPGEVYTNPDGFYQGTIPCGWSGTITPVLECWGFSPTGRTYSDVRDDQTGQNFLAIPATFTLSGWVRDATGAPMPGVSMNGLPCGEVITDPTGFYRCAVPCGWSGIVTPVLQDCSFTPPSRNYVNVRTSIPDQDYVGECGPPSCDPGFELVDTQAGTGGVAGVRIVANGMQTMPIGGLEFHIDYPPSCMSCTEVVSDYLTAPTVNCGSGEVHIVWDDFANPITVPDGDVIAVILFDVLGNTGDVCDVCWAQGNEVVDPFGDPIGGLGYCCGTVTVEESDRCISGNVVYYDMVKKMPDVTVVLSPGGTTATDAAGHYEFCGLAPGNYTVKPVHGNNDPGVSVGDVIKIRRHLAVLEPFTSGYQLIAADVTCDCNVSVSDIIKIRRFLAVLDTLPCGNWQFVDSSYNVTTTDWCPVPDEINALLTNFDQTDSSFVGVRKGDVNNTWTPSAPFASSRQDDNLQATAGALALKLEDAHPVSNVVAIPLALGSGRIAGLELHLEYDSDHLAFTGFNSEQLSGITLNDDGSRLHLVWEDLDNVIEHDAEKQIAQIEFAVVNSSGEFTEIDITSAEVVDESGTPFVLTGRNSRVFLSDGDGLVPDGFWLGQNYPNPFNPDTDIDFYLPQQSDVTLAVYNMLGQQVRVLVSSSLTSGTHTAHWDGRDESGRAVSSGIYLYRLHANEFIDSHKMLMLK